MELRNGVPQNTITLIVKFAVMVYLNPKLISVMHGIRSLWCTHDPKINKRYVTLIRYSRVHFHCDYESLVGLVRPPHHFSILSTWPDPLPSKPCHFLANPHRPSSVGCPLPSHQKRDVTYGNLPINVL